MENVKKFKVAYIFPVPYLRFEKGIGNQLLITYINWSAS